MRTEKLMEAFLVGLGFVIFLWGSDKLGNWVGFFKMKWIMGIVDMLLAYGIMHYGKGKMDYFAYGGFAVGVYNIVNSFIAL